MTEIVSVKRVFPARVCVYVGEKCVHVCKREEIEGKNGKRGRGGGK